MEDQTSTLSLEKLKSLLREANDSSILETIGKGIQPDQLTALSGLLLGEYIEKFPAILVGLPHSLFMELLKHADDSNLHILKALASSEPLQHHLTMAGHDLQQQIFDCELQIGGLTNEIAALETTQMGRSDLQAIESKIADAAKGLQELTLVVNKSLAIAWNTSRIDLIETLSHTKERAESLLAHGIGRKRCDEHHSSGLYAKLEERLFHIYSNGNAFENLKDEEPAIEAIAKFSIWYLKDYWEIGLLPHIKQLDESESRPLQEKQHEQEALLQQVNINLKQLGLKTLSDLKQARIFSKQSLSEFIREHQAKIKT